MNDTLGDVCLEGLVGWVELLSNFNNDQIEYEELLHRSDFFYFLTESSTPNGPIKEAYIVSGHACGRKLSKHSITLYRIE